MDFIIVAKPGSNATLFESVQERLQQGLCTEWEEADELSMVVEIRTYLVNNAGYRQRGW